MLWEYIHTKILEISTLSTADYALINATWLTLTVDEFKCAETEAILSKRKDAKTAIEYVRKSKGCGVISHIPKVEVDGVEYYSCLCHKNFQDSSIHESIWLYKQYKTGHLGFEGGLMEQPAKYIELIRLLDRLNIEYENRMIEEQKER